MYRFWQFRWRPAALFALLWLVSVGSAAAFDYSGATTTVYVIGSSPLVKNNPAAGRDAAVQNGLAAAVCQVLVGLSSPEAVTVGFQSLNATCLRQPERYIEEYKVVAEARTQNIQRLLLEVMVSVERLQAFALPAARVAGEITVEVEGTSGNIAGFVQLRRRLGDTVGVSGVQLQEMAADSARLVVTSSDSTQALADVLRTYTFETFAIEIEQVTETSIRLHLRSL